MERFWWKTRPSQFPHHNLSLSLSLSLGLGLGLSISLSPSLSQFPQPTI